MILLVCFGVVVGVSSDPAVEAAARAWHDRYGDRLVGVEESAAHNGVGELTIAAAREALKPLRTVHKALTIEVLVCAEECEDEAHEDGCPVVPRDVCAHCWEIATEKNDYYGELGISETIVWPCATAKLVYPAEELR